MNISYYLQGKKELASIYVRVRDTNFDAKTSTKLKVNPKNFKNGIVRQISNTPNIIAEEKKRIIEQNKNLIELQKKVDITRETITNAYNNVKDYEIINTDWLKRVLNPVKTNEKPNTLIGYFDYYLDFKKASLKASTLKNVRVIRNRVAQYEKDVDKLIYIQEVDKGLSFSIQMWCDENDYHHNTKVKTIKIILTICNFASDNGTPTNLDLKKITKGLAYKDSPFITLSFDEIEKIVDTPILDKQLSIAKDWLIISCYTAQRVSDNLYLKKENIVYKNREYLLEIRQEKTENPVSITLNDKVVKILKKYDGNFPPAFSKNKDSNEIIYNRLIKKVCKFVKIENIVSSNFKNPKTNRYELKEMPKYNAVTSHIGRRSFATNYYGLIPTALLIGQTGHKTEIQFLRYIGKTGNQNAVRLAEKMREVEQNRILFKEQQKESKLIQLSAVN